MVDTREEIDRRRKTKTKTKTKTTPPHQQLHINIIKQAAR